MNLTTQELKRREERTCLDFDIIIAGAKKAGTSTLLSHLLCADGVAALHRSEMPYFTEDEEYGRGPEAAITKYFGGEASPARVRVAKDFLLNKPQAMPRVLADSPRAQIIAVLREPVSRAYSSFWFARRRGFEPESDFGKAVERELEGKELSLPRGDLREHVRGGEYAGQLESLFEQIDRDRVRILLLEDLHADPRGIANELLAPYGVQIPAGAAPASRTNSSARPRSTLLARIGSSPRVRSMARPFVSPSLRGSAEQLIRRINDVPFKPPPMEQAVRERLAAHYEPQIDRLSALIGRDLDGWKQG
jgi:sulfotransferase family protein